MTKARRAVGVGLALVLGWAGCVPPKSPANPRREQERMTEISWVLNHLKTRRSMLSEPEVLESLQGAVNEDAAAIERGDIVQSEGWTRMMRRATAAIRKEHPNATIRGYPIVTHRLDSLSFPLELEEAKGVRVLITVVSPRDGDDKYKVFVIAELLGRQPEDDFKR
jgi:hypothetical protein